MIGVLRSVPGDERPERPLPTLADVPELIDESRAAGMTIRSALEAGEAPESVGRNAYRIVQEGLTNARKHARAAPVDLRIDGAPGMGLSIQVRNPAPVPASGAVEIPGSGTGLVGLAERAMMSGGHLEHGLDEHGDFQLRAWLPWPE